MSKGSRQRPVQNKEQFEKNWDAVFGKKDKPSEEKQQEKKQYFHWILGAGFEDNK